MSDSDSFLDELHREATLLAKKNPINCPVRYIDDTSSSSESESEELLSLDIALPSVIMDDEIPLNVEDTADLDCFSLVALTESTNCSLETNPEFIGVGNAI